MENNHYEFVLAYSAQQNKIRILNSSGHIAIVTLWSLPDIMIQKMKENHLDLHSVAAVGTLYGNGLPELLRNLLYNPQITTLIIVGSDKSGSKQELINFFKKGIEPCYFCGEQMHRITDTNRIIDNLVTPSHFLNDLHIIDAASDSFPYFNLVALKDALNSSSEPIADTIKRIQIPLCDPPKRITRPSNICNHNIVADDAITAWEQIIKKVFLFGIKTELAKGFRIILPYVKATINKPDLFDDASFEKYHLSKEHYQQYYEHFLDPVLPQDKSYTYGNRLKQYFHIDTINKAIEKINADMLCRDALICLWDTSRDLPSNSGHPCLYALYIQCIESRLSLLALFRTHNLMDAWPENFYGLLKIMHTICDRTNIPPGKMIIISNSISIAPEKEGVAQKIVNNLSYRSVKDPNGYFQISTEQQEIVARLYYDYVLIKEFRGKKPDILFAQIAHENAISDIGHAMHIAGQIQKAYTCILTNTIYNQE